MPVPPAFFHDTPAASSPLPCPVCGAPRYDHANAAYRGACCEYGHWCMIQRDGGWVARDSMPYFTLANRAWPDVEGTEPESLDERPATRRETV